MEEWIIQEAENALQNGFEGVLALTKRWGQVGPYLFRNREALDKIAFEPIHRLAKTLTLMLKKHPETRIAAILRGCDVRAIRKLGEKGEISTDRLHIIGIPCSYEQAELCNCEKPIYNTLDCTGCWKCMDACKEQAIRRINTCPIAIPNEFDMNLSNRKAIYIPYPQAVPLKATRDLQNCLKITGAMDCKGCERVCQAEAIIHEDAEVTEEIHVGSVILAPGFAPYDPSDLDFYGFGHLPNVVTSMQFERLLSASGPFGGHLVRLSDHQEPKKIAWVQCVGSRDSKRCDHAYCSSVCCMYAIKEAMIAKEHAGGDLDCTIFYMDMRTYGKDFERYYDDAREKHGIRFLRSRIHTVDTTPDGDMLTFRYSTEGGDPVTEIFDMVVLSVGLETPPELVDLSRDLGIALTEGNFCETSSFAPVTTSRNGIFVSGAFQNPKDIPQSVIDASAAACAAGEALSGARHTLTKTKEVIPETNVKGQRPSIGIFICRCGINIAGVVDIDKVRDYAAGLPYVNYVTDNLYTCSQDTQDTMSQVIKEQNLNRIVVAACTPKTHEPLFQETLINASLNKYLFEMVNIRNQDSWVHKDNPELATEKAKDLVRMAVAKVALMDPLQESTLEIDQGALVIGGGISGLTAAKSLSAQGYPVCLVERSSELGGQALNLFRTWKGEDVQQQLADLVTAVNSDPNIDVCLNTEVANVEGFVGNFETTLAARNGEEKTLEHGVAVISTGASEYQPDEYLCGKDPRVMTHLELDRRFLTDDPALKEIKSAVFIQCVGSREPERPYCSRVCCTHTMESALHLKNLNPQMDVMVLYRDIRTYGEREYVYRKARMAGVKFLRYSLDQKPKVYSEGDTLRIKVMDRILARTMVIETDLLCLSTAIVPYRDETLAQFFKVPMNQDGFFVEAHAKLGPSKFATDGVFLCGMAHYPKPIDESVGQSLAAASCAITLLARKRFAVSGTVATANPLYCSSCGVCIELCPFSAPSFVEEGRFEGKAEVNPVLCKGCGLCVASCRSGAMNLKGFGDDQIMAMIDQI
ncbi:MAG: FAD-dependent oxidoreductase [Deltaproteobacteria bacterium]|nr:FAD-dependent oxidoreductase [Deltaproteobacteria bacterium]